MRRIVAPGFSTAELGKIAPLGAPPGARHPGPPPHRCAPVLPWFAGTGMSRQRTDSGPPRRDSSDEALGATLPIDPPEPSPPPPGIAGGSRSAALTGGGPAGAAEPAF